MENKMEMVYMLDMINKREKEYGVMEKDYDGLKIEINLFVNYKLKNYNLIKNLYFIIKNFNIS